MKKIKIYSDTEKGCIFFDGSTVEPKFIGTVIATAHPEESDRVIIKRTDRLQADGVSFRVLFRRLNVERIDNRNGENLVSDLGYTTSQVVEYLNEQANDFQTASAIRLTLDDTPDFSLDDTGTTILIDNGDKHPVNSIKAILADDGMINIVSHSGGDITYYEGIEPSTVMVSGQPVSGGPSDTVNTLNELFAAGPFQSVVVSDPYSTMIADVNGVDAGYALVGSTAVDPAGNDIFGNTGSGNYAGLLSAETISQAGEYYTFDIRGEGQIGFGLVHTQDSYDAGRYSGNSSYADPSGFAVGNSAHYGYQFSHWFHPTPNGSWTNYGANTGYSARAGWSNWDQQGDWLAGNPVKIRCGIDTNGYISIESLQDDNTWVAHARTSYPVSQGSEFKLGIKAAHPSARVYSAPKVHQLAVDDTPAVIGDSSITVFGEGITGTLAGGISSSATDDFDNDGFVTTETISSIGEYFELDWSSGGDFNFGLFSENDHDVADLTTDITSWSNSKYIFYGSEGRDGGGIQGARTDSGLGYTNIGDGTTADYKARVGFDASGRPTVWGSADAGATWFVFHRANASAPVGDYKFIMIAEEAGVVFNGLTKGTQTFAPTMHFRYVESPDGAFNYPVFATEEEANYYDLQEGGAGTSHTHIYVDDPSNTTWHMPDTNRTMSATVAPTSAQTFMGNAINWTEVTTLANADLVPTAFADSTITVDELTSVNVQVHPQGAAFATTIVDTDGSGLLLSSASLNVYGTAPEVTGNTTTNPSDSYNIEIVRTNSYGSSSGTLTIQVTNLTPPSSLPSGFTQVAGSFTDNGDGTFTVDNSSVVEVDLNLAEGKRIIVPAQWVETNVLPFLDYATSESKAFFGIADVAPDWTDTPDLHDDFDAVFRWEALTSTSHKHSMSVGDLIGANDNSVSSASVAYWNCAIEWDGTDLHVMRSPTLSDLQTKHRDQISGDIITDAPATSRSGALPLVVATRSGGGMSLTTTGLSIIDIPAAPVTNITPWTKALDFDGSSEHLKQVNNSMYGQALQMNGLASTVDLGTRSQGETSDNSLSRPWATVVVFKSDGYSGNQMIWNQGEGSTSGNDNIFLNVTASGNVNLGWGREGTGYNQCRIATGINSSTWYGVYIAHTGERLSGNNASASNLADCFDVRIMSSADSFASLSSNLSTTANWVVSGYRMDRTVAGVFTVGGRGDGYSFRGKVASMIVTTLIGAGSFTEAQQPGGLMYNDAQIEKMITDPIYWVNEYKVRHGLYNTSGPFRPPASQYTLMPFLIGSETSAYRATQVWLMGDGASDSYANGVRNYIYTDDQNYSKLQLNSMVSNDIETVTIPGLT